jgi:hypothetical protein
MWVKALIRYGNSKTCCITAAQDSQKGSGIEEQAMPIDLG